MKSLATLASLLLGAAVAHAAPPGLNLSWDECGAAGALNRDFACDTNEGSHALVGSLVAPEEAALVEMETFTALLRIDFESAVPDWWQLQSPGGCRAAGAALDFDFGDTHACENRWLVPPAASGWYAAQTSPASLVINLVAILDPSQRAPLSAGLEYYLFKLVINHIRTTGPGNCLGCPDSARITLSQAVISPPLPYSEIHLVDPSTRNHVLWQQSIVPVRPTSWSTIKQLYR